MSSPQIIFLDEPTRALDPIMAKRVRDSLKLMVKKHNLQIILTSHNMYELEEIGNQLFLINNGKLIFEGKPQELSSFIDARKIIKCSVLNESIIKEIETIDSNITVQNNQNTTSIYSPLKTIVEILEKIPKTCFDSLLVENFSLEDSYIKFLSSKSNNYR